MKTNLKGLLAVLLALVLVFSLVACGDREEDAENGEEGVSGGETTGAADTSGTDETVNSVSGGDSLSSTASGAMSEAPSGGDSSDAGSSGAEEQRTEPEGNNYQLLSDAFAKTAEDLTGRYDVAPFSAICEILSGSAATLNVNAALSVPDAGDISLGGSLSVDHDAEKLLLNAFMEMQGVEIHGKLYGDPDFVGVSCPFLLGSETFYGFAPHDLYEQASGSALDSAAGEMGLDLESLQELDSLLASLKDGGAFDIAAGMEDMLESIVDIAEKYADEHPLESAPGKVSYMGQELDGTVLKTNWTADQLADCMKELMEAVVKSDWFESLMELSGEDMDGVDLDAEIQSAVDELRNSGVAVSTVYYVANDRVVSIECDAGDAHLVTDFYGPDGKSVLSTLTSTQEEGSLVCSSTVDTAGGLVMAFNACVTSDGTTETADFRVTYDEATGDLSLRVSVPSDELADMEFTGSLTLTDTAFTFRSQELALDIEGQELTATLTVSGQKGAVIPDVTDRTNIFSLSEEEIEELLAPYVQDYDY